MRFYICLYVHLYEYLGMIYMSDNNSVHKQIFEFFLSVYTYNYMSNYTYLCYK